jgi:replication factor A2
VSANIMINSYVRVVGAVRSHGDTKAIMIFKIQPIKSINELNTHYIEVVNARYVAEEYMNGLDKADKLSIMQVDAPISGNSTSQGMKGKEHAIFELIRAADISTMVTGYSRAEIEARFPHITPAEIRSSLDKLIYEGHVYTTIDNDHFQACF